MNEVVISDLDGTIADIGHRVHHIRGGENDEQDWDAFFAACPNDKPIEPTIYLLRLLKAQGYRIHILTGRNETVMAETIGWLTKHDVPCDRMLMRAEHDRRPDHELKAQWLEQYGFTPEATLTVLEDRDRVVGMYRELGFTVWQVADGAY